MSADVVRARGADRTTRWAVRLLVVAAVAYSGVLLEAAVGYPLDPRRAYLSELAASDQPTRWLFRGADVLAGTCVVAAVAVLRAVARPVRGPALSTATLAAATVFGAATVLDALAPMRCAQAGSAACARLLAGGRGGLLHEVHLVCSVVANLAAVAMALGVLLLVVGRRGPVAQPVAQPVPQPVPQPVMVAQVVAGVVAASAVLLTMPVAVLSLLEELDVPAPAGLGIFQRAQTVAFSLTLLFLVRCTTRAHESLRGGAVPHNPPETDPVL